MSMTNHQSCMYVFREIVVMSNAYNRLKYVADSELRPDISLSRVYLKTILLDGHDALTKSFPSKHAFLVLAEACRGNT